VGAAADLESEKLMQRVSYLNMCGSIAPMLGLLGTVQGMIMAFANLANTQAGAAQQSMLAMNIAQALWTTAAGLCVAIPAVSFYTYFKNRLSRYQNVEGLTIGPSACESMQTPAAAPKGFPSRKNPFSSRPAATRRPVRRSFKNAGHMSWASRSMTAA